MEKGLIENCTTFDGVFSENLDPLSLVASYLSFKDIFSLRLTCKDLDKAFNKSKVWETWFRKLNKSTYTTQEYNASLRLAYKFRALEKNLGVRGINLSPSYDLRPYQIDTLEWMKQREKNFLVRGGIVSLEMGLGKTLIGLVYLLTNKKEYPSLVVCSKTVMTHWFEDKKKFFGRRHNVLFFHKDFMGKGFDVMPLTRAKKYDIVVTTYDVCNSAATDSYLNDCLVYGDEHTLMKGKVIEVQKRKRYQVKERSVRGRSILYEMPWERVIADESQRFANPRTKSFRAMMALYGGASFCLTGTPLRNYETDIWAQLRFCGLRKFPAAKDWKSHSFEAHNLGNTIFRMGYKEAKVVIPQKTVHNISVHLDDEEYRCYTHVMKLTREAYDQMTAKLVNYACVLAMFIRLRQCCIAPYLMTPHSKRVFGKKKLAEPSQSNMIELSDLGKFIFNKHGAAGIMSKKISKIIEVLRSIPKGEKVLLFSSFTSCLDLVQYALERRMPEFNSLMLDGSVIGSERRSMINKFKTDENVNGFFINFRVGAEGLNLTEANHVICIEPWWTYAVPKQAVARCWRVGQTKEVHEYNIVVEDTIEQRVLDLCQSKEKMAESYLDKSTTKKTGAGLDKHTMGRILGIL